MEDFRTFPPGLRTSTLQVRFRCVAGHGTKRCRSAFLGRPATQIGHSAHIALQVRRFLQTCNRKALDLQQRRPEPATELPSTCNREYRNLQQRRPGPATKKDLPGTDSPASAIRHMGEKSRGREGETGRKGGLYRDLFDCAPGTSWSRTIG